MLYCNKVLTVCKRLQKLETIAGTFAEYNLFFLLQQ